MLTWNPPFISNLQGEVNGTYIEHMRFEKTSAPPIRGNGLHACNALPAQARTLGCLHEVYAAPDDWAAAIAFALTMLGDVKEEAKAGAQEGAVLVIRSAKRHLPAFLYGEGLIALGIAPDRLLFAQAKDTLELLRASVDATRCRGISIVLLETWGPCPEWNLTASRRFSLAAERSGVTVLVMRGDAQEQPSSAQTRWRVTSAPSTALAANAPGLPAIDVELLRQRGGPAGMRWRLEWDMTHEHFREAALSGTVVPLSGLRAGATGLSRAA